MLERNRESHLAWKEQLGINDNNKYEFYSQYYERRFKRAIDGYNYLEKLMESAKPSIGYVMLSYILTHTRHNVVITTNFDHLLEDAVNYYENMIPLVIGHESLAHYITKQINRPTIIKIHRDLLLEPKNREPELNVLHDNWKKALAIVFSEYYPIFIGYAGNDHSLMDYLIQNNEVFSGGNGALPYWMIYKNDKMSETVEEFLNKSEGYLVKHNGFDEVLYLLGDIFDYRLPSKEDFISDAEKRFKMLSDAIDRFTELTSVNKKINQEENDITDNQMSETAEVKQAVQNITSQTESQDLFREALLLIITEQYHDALEILSKLIEKNSSNARYIHWRGYVLHKLGHYEEALIEEQRAVKLEPEEALYHNSLGETLEELGRHEEALEEKQRAVELEPEEALYYYGLGDTLYELGRYEQALEEKQRALELEPEEALYYDDLGDILYELGRYEEALKEKRRAVELEPEDAYYHNSLGDLLHELGRHEEALEEKQRALELEPKEALYHDDLGDILYELGRYEEALKEKRRAVELESEEAYYHNSLGDLLHDLGRYEDALKEKQRALELEPDNTLYQDLQGQTGQEQAESQ